MVRQGGSSKKETAAEGQGDHSGGGPQQGRQAQEAGAGEAHESYQDSWARAAVLPDLWQTRGRWQCLHLQWSGGQSRKASKQGWYKQILLV